MFINIKDPENPIYPFDVSEYLGTQTTLEELNAEGIYNVSQDESFDIQGYYEVTETSAPYQDSDGNWKISVVSKQIHPAANTILDVATSKIRKERDSLIEQQSWRYERYAREVRLGITPTDNIEVLDTYIQTLADITDQEDFPWEVSWPDKV